MYCYIRLAWLSRTSIAVTSGRINQNSYPSRKYFCFNSEPVGIGWVAKTNVRHEKTRVSICYYIATWNSARHRIGVVAFVLRRLIGPNLFAFLLFKACLSANFSRTRYWPYSKGDRPIYIFRPIQPYPWINFRGIRGMKPENGTLFGSHCDRSSYLKVSLPQAHPILIGDLGGLEPNSPHRLPLQHAKAI